METIHILKKLLTRDLKGARKVFYHEITGTEYEYWNGIRLLFQNINYRVPNDMTLTIMIPEELLHLEQMDASYRVYYEDFLLRSVSPGLSELAASLVNDNRETRARGEIHIQEFDKRIVKRTGMTYEDGFFRLRIMCRLPLMGVEHIEAKACVRLIGSILQCITTWAEHFSDEELLANLDLYKEQQEIRNYISENGYCCFIGNGSVITRNEKGDGPLENAIPFVSPTEDEIAIPLSNGKTIRGMAIRKNTVTVITGGGYSGKTTLLDGIESGIYDHVRGDGREYIITDQTALKTFAEDGRPVNHLNLSPFFKDDFLDQHIDSFYTDYASGSVSQAANIVEALYAGSKLLLVDEDKSATNFLVKDEMMRRINPNDPIIPFTDRIREIVDEKNASVIMVVGAVSAYFEYADTIFLAEKFSFRNVTGIVPKKTVEERDRCSEWGDKRICQRSGDWKDTMFRTVNTENSRMIYVGSYCVDVLPLSAIVSNDQLNSLAYAMERLLSQPSSFEIREMAEKLVDELLLEDTRPATSLERMISQKNRWFEEVRPIDIICCLSRVRGVCLGNVSYMETN